ncbi:MAG: hypothetical protein OEZ01_05735 [Candidatus Heimdallarchaeota archaeon]|nr:hypothetical protein [Candidatus Heimdallarchaeota archaeon]MDH5645486.1 hypothetical protein [Candidatus Heimdallarchaeota archaeon]
MHKMLNDDSKIDLDDLFDSILDNTITSIDDIPLEVVSHITNRVELIDDSIILIHIFPIKIKLISDLLFRKMDELTSNLSKYHVIIYSDGNDDIGDEEFRNWGVEQLQSREKLIHISFVLEVNSLILILVRFMMTRIKYKSYSIHKNKIDAINYIKDLQSKYTTI